MRLANSAFERIAEIVKDGHSSKEWVHFMNRFGYRNDVMQNGHLPNVNGNDLNTTKNTYLTARLNGLNDSDVLRLCLLQIVAEYPDCITVLNNILHEDNFKIVLGEEGYYLEGDVVKNNPIVEIDANFLDNQNKILAALDTAKVSIRVALAWFTNQKLADKLIEKYHEGVEVAVAIFDHPANHRNPVDLKDVPVRWLKGSRGGLMHNKFCIIDNQTVITGSYNWSSAAEYKNDENVMVTYKALDAAIKYSLEFRKLTGGFRG